MSTLSSPTTTNIIQPICASILLAHLLERILGVNELTICYQRFGLLYSGRQPYKRPPYMPSLSNFHLDLMPYEVCCMWAGHCEFFYWRRQTSGCQNYKPAAFAYAFGDPHFVTFDNVKYNFQVRRMRLPLPFHSVLLLQGRGYYVLTSMSSPHHSMMIQVRMEQPPPTTWGAPVLATAITGVAATVNGSSKVEIYARKEYRRWRYRTDVYVDGVRVFFDGYYQRTQNYLSMSVRVPADTFDMGKIEVLFDTGLGLRVEEDQGWLAVLVSVPPTYLARHKSLSELDYDYTDFIISGEPIGPAYADDDVHTLPASALRCPEAYMTMGLLGTYNGNSDDDLTDPDCESVG